MLSWSLLYNLSSPKGILKQRKAWASTSCFSTKTRPEFVPFSQKVIDGGMSGIARESGEGGFQNISFNSLNVFKSFGS